MPKSRCSCRVVWEPGFEFREAQHVANSRLTSREPDRSSTAIRELLRPEHDARSCAGNKTRGGEIDGYFSSAGAKMFDGFLGQSPDPFGISSGESCRQGLRTRGAFEHDRVRLLVVVADDNPARLDCVGCRFKKLLQTQ